MQVIDGTSYFVGRGWGQQTLCQNVTMEIDRLQCNIFFSGQFYSNGAFI